MVRCSDVLFGAKHLGIMKCESGFDADLHQLLKKYRRRPDSTKIVMPEMSSNNTYNRNNS